MRAGVRRAFCRIAVRSVMHIAPGCKAELEHTDTGKAAFFDKHTRLCGIIAEVLGDDELIARDILDHFCKLKSGTAPPFALARGIRVPRYRKVRFHRAEMVDPYPVKH